MNYKINLEAAIIVKDVKGEKDAISIALSESGKKLNPKLKYVEVNIKESMCEACKKKKNEVLIIANTALVGLSLDIKIYNAESKEHASRIARSVIGKAFKNVSLKINDIIQI